MFQTTRRRAQRTHTPLSWALGLVLLLLPAKVSVAAGPDFGGVTQREIALLQFYGGGRPLTGQERQEAADMMQLEMQRAPQAEIAADADAAKLLRVLAQAPAPLIALAREGGRLNAQLHNAVDPALQQQQALEARIIAAHDPVVVFDPAHKRLVSEQTLRVLQSADAFGATVFDVPRPGADFIAQMRQIMPHAYSEMDDGMQDALAHAERDLPYVPGFLQGINPQKRASFAQVYHAKIMAAPDPAAQQLNLAKVMAVVGMTAYRHSRSSGGAQGSLADRLQTQDLVNRQLEGSVRSYSPTCNVTRPDAMANFAYCHP